MTDESPDQKPTAEVAMELVSALGRRADRVDVEPTPQARAAVERRRRRRARRRQVRRGALAAAVVVALGGSAAVVRLVDDGPDSAVVADGGADPVWCDQALRPGQASDDPALLGLPRLVFDGAAGLTPTVPAAPLVAVTPDDDPGNAQLTQVQQFRPRDEALPLILAPWSPAGAQLPLPVPGEGNERVEVGDIPAALEGDPPGWTRLAWPMPDGTKAHLEAYGVSREALLTFAEGLTRPDPSQPGYVAQPPPGFEETVLDIGGRSDDEGQVAMYRYDAVSADVEVGVEVWTEPLPSSPSSSTSSSLSPIKAVLGQAEEAAAIEVLDGPGILAGYGDGSWMVAWSAGKCLANLRIDGADRDEVDELVAALHIADDAEWATLLTEGRS